MIEFSTWSRIRVLLNVRTLLLGCVVIAVLLSLRNAELFDAIRLTSGARQEFSRFFSTVWQPTLHSQGEFGLSLWPAIKEGVVNTVLVAFAAMSLAMSLGFVLGCFISEALWESDDQANSSFLGRFMRRVLRPGMLVVVRSIMAAVRSVHELVWALLLTSMFSVHVLCGIVAVALPYAATLGRIYGEMIDEVPRDAARSLRWSGAGPLAVFSFGLLPRALPAMLSYSFYRFDCCLRSTAVLGFVGFPTLGLFIKNSFNYAYYREVWTYLWVLLVLLTANELLSSFVRRRIAA